MSELHPLPIFVSSILTVLLFSVIIVVAAWVSKRINKKNKDKFN